VLLTDGVDDERGEVRVLPAVGPPVGEGAGVVGGQVDGVDGRAAGELLGEHPAQVGLVHRCRRVLRHHGVAVQPVDLAGEGGVVVAERGEAAEPGLGRCHWDGAVLVELFVQQFDAPADAADRG
jgi:hypothetical protein